MKVVFFANPSSIHVKRWLDLTRAANIEVDGWSADDILPPDQDMWRTATRFGGVLRYVLSGIRMRVHRSGRSIVHAHGASGYGLMAWLTGAPYIVTIYGSEVYLADERGPTYRLLLGRILRGAVRITCTTPAMRDHVITNFGVEANRVHMFSMGISLSDFYPSEVERGKWRKALNLEKAIVITSHRRLRPQYRIDLLVHAFAALQTRDERYRLILLEGDSFPEYTQEISRIIEDEGIADKVLLIRGFRSAEEVRKYLLVSDLVVSIPTSDQMSAAILEALACGATVVAAPIPAYDELFKEGLAYRASIESPESLAASLAQAAASRQAKSVATSNTQVWLEQHHSDEVVVREIVELYAEATRG